MVMLIGINAFDSIVFLEVILNEQFKDLGVDGYLGKADEDASRYLLMHDLVEPVVLPNIAYFKTLLWISIEDVSQYLLAVR
jgi:hypothetical protein